MESKVENKPRHRCTSNCDHTEYAENSPLLRSGASSQRYSAVNNDDEDGLGAPPSCDYSDLSGSGQHCHDTAESPERLDKRAIRKLVFATILCLLFMIAEIVGGFLANSLAIATDAAHLLTDLISFIISLFAVFIASRAPTKRMSFGFYRAEVMGALISTLMIWVVTGILVYLAIQRVVSMDYEIDADIMLITSAVAIVCNIIMACCLGHAHSHGHSHDSGDEDKQQLLIPQPDVESGSGDHNNSHNHHHQKHGHGHNINVRAAFIHVIGDFIQSLGVFVAALVIWFKPEWKIADPICTFLFSVLVLITTFSILKDTFNVLMEGLPRGMEFNDVKQTLMSVQGVREVHNLRLWSLTVNKCALAVHLAIDRSVSGQQIVTATAAIMRKKYGINECTVQVEDYVDEMLDCTHCQDPKD